MGLSWGYWISGILCIIFGFGTEKRNILAILLLFSLSLRLLNSYQGWESLPIQHCLWVGSSLLLPHKLWPVDILNLLHKKLNLSLFMTIYSFWDECIKLAQDRYRWTNCEYMHDFPSLLWLTHSSILLLFGCLRTITLSPGWTNALRSAQLNCFSLANSRIYLALLLLKAWINRGQRTIALTLPQDIWWCLIESNLQSLPNWTPWWLSTMFSLFETIPYVEYLPSTLPFYISIISFFRDYTIILSVLIVLL